MSNSLKDLYNQDYLSLLALHLYECEVSFSTQDFLNSVFDIRWKERELKQRMRHISHCLHLALNFSYPQVISILEKVFFKMNSANALENMIFQDYVEVYGLNDFNTSMKALESFTQGSSSEFAIRAFIFSYEDKTMDVLKEWTQSKNEHVRRLASEGCRPRLPWAVALENFKTDPRKVIEVLQLLKDDNSPYVQKSVANALNDISKDHRTLVKTLAHVWLKENAQRKWLVKHGCRTLLKQGDKEVLSLFGFEKADHLMLKNFRCLKQVKQGAELMFEFDVESKRDVLGKLRLEYALEFVRLNGRTSRKVFKISEGDFTSKTKSVCKKYSFKPISTRKYYRGEHKLSVIINGEVLHEVVFELI